MNDFTDIQLQIRVYNSDDLLADDIAKEIVHIYPYGEAKAADFVREVQPEDLVILENDAVSVTVTGYEVAPIWGYCVNLFPVNKSDKNVMFRADEASINGIMADPIHADYVSAGKCAFGTMTWMNTTLEENGITDVEEIEFKLKAYDYDDWMADNLAEEVITLTPNH